MGDGRQSPGATGAGPTARGGAAAASPRAGGPAPRLETTRDAAPFAAWLSKGQSLAVGASRLAATGPRVAAAALALVAGKGKSGLANAAALLGQLSPAAAKAIEQQLGGLLSPKLRQALAAAKAGRKKGAVALGATGRKATRKAGVGRDRLGAEAAPAPHGSRASGKANASLRGSIAGALAQASPSVRASVSRVLAAFKRGPAAAAEALDDELRAEEPEVAAGQHLETDREAGEGDQGERAANLLMAIRATDFAGLKAMALDRAGLHLTELRTTGSEGRVEAAGIRHMRESTARLLASDPGGIAQFARENPEHFPPASAATVVGELLLGQEPETWRALAAAFGSLLGPADTPARSNLHAWAAGYLGGAGARAVIRRKAPPELADAAGQRLLSTIVAAGTVARGESADDLDVPTEPDPALSDPDALPAMLRERLAAALPHLDSSEALAYIDAGIADSGLHLAA